MITLACKTSRHEDIGIGYDLATNQLILWTENETHCPKQQQRRITFAELAALHPDLAADVAVLLPVLHGGYEA